jgi:hypothetical protein
MSKNAIPPRMPWIVPCGVICEGGVFIGSMTKGPERKRQAAKMAISIGPACDTFLFLNPAATALAKKRKDVPNIRKLAICMNPREPSDNALIYIPIAVYPGRSQPSIVNVLTKNTGAMVPAKAASWKNLLWGFSMA